MDSKFIEHIRFESAKTYPLTETAELSYQIENTKKTLLSNALKVSKSTVPLIQTHIEECSNILNLNTENIECYVYATPDHNAFSISQGEGNILVAISSSLVKILKHGELKFLIGHELGHSLFSHSELTHLGYGKMDYDSTRSLREMEISADRIGYLCANSLENSITAMMKIASGLDDEYLNQDIRPFLDQSQSLSEQVENNQYSKATHPPLPLRARSLVWLSTINPFKSGISKDAVDQKAKTAILQINSQIRSDISTLIDKAMEMDFQKDSEFFKLLLLTSQLASNGTLTKYDQELIINECGEDSNKLFSLMSSLSKNQVENMLVRKLRESFTKMSHYSNKDSRILFQQYSNKYGISKDYLDILP